MSNLIVTDANGRKYKPTGHFREPENGEPYWSVTSQSVCKYNAAVGYTGDHPFGAMAIVLEPVPVEYVAHVRLTQEQFDRYKGFAESATAHALDSLNVIATAIRNGDYEEVPQ